MISTERLIIRNFEERDRNTLRELLMNEEFMAFSVSGTLGYENASLRVTKIISNTSKHMGKKAIFLKETRELIGYCGIEPFSLNGSVENEFGYRLAVQYRGKGMATEASKALLSVASISNLYAYVEEENLKSINVLKKLGFTSCGLYNTETKQYKLFRFTKISSRSSL